MGSTPDKVIIVLSDNPKEKKFIKQYNTIVSSLKTIKSNLSNYEINKTNIKSEIDNIIDVLSIDENKILNNIIVGKNDKFINLELTQAINKTNQLISSKE